MEKTSFMVRMWLMIRTTRSKGFWCEEYCFFATHM